MNGTLEKLSRELSLSVSSDYIRSKLEAYGVFHNNFRQSKSLRISPTSSIESCSPEKLPPEFAVNGLSTPVRTTQLVYYVKDGKEYRGLCEPRTVAYTTTQHTHSTLPMWPVEVDCVNFRPKFIQNEPEEREPLYFPDAPVPTPPVLSADRKGHVVYMNQPSPAQWFTGARQGPSLSSAGFAQRDPDDISLSFESRFESGNLSKAVQVGKWEYELYLRPDLYTGKHTQWFYFGVRNMRPGHTYRFTIVNFYKAGSLYNSGMRPLMYSERQAAKGVGWRRVGSNIKYFKTSIRREGVVVERFYYALTWTCRFPVSGDTCYFAHCFPYTYSDLKDYLQKLTARPEVSKFCRQRTLCHTIAGNPVPVLTIAAPSSSVSEAKAKKAVVITARVHPGESNASWMMKGLLDFLTSNHSDAKLLREMFVFKVVPMLNPDGVIIGNYRCSLAGRDLNRNYRSDLKEAYPPVWYVKAMVQKLASERDVVMYCDLHGHSRRQNVFIYGCVGLPGTDPEHNLLSRVFPKMMSLNTPDKFSYKYSTFTVHKSKEGTGRVVMWRQMGILNSFTMEATFCGSNLEGKCHDRHFTARDFESMGYHLCDTLLDYCDPDQSNVEFVLHGLREERRKEIIEHLTRVGVEIPPDTDPLELEGHMPREVASSSDEGSDSSLSDGAPVGHFSLKPSVPAREERRRKKSKKRRKPKSKRSSVHQIAKLKMAHREAVKSVDDTDSAILGAPSTQSEPIPMETKLKLPSAQSSHSASAEPRKGSAASSVSAGRGPTPTVGYKHRLSTTGGMPIYVQERLEERQRRRSDAESIQPTVSGFGSEASVHLEPSWSLQRLQNMAPAAIQDYWKSYHQPLTVSALLPQKADGVEDGSSYLPSDKSLPQISPSHLHHGRGVDCEMLPTDSAHLMASQMKEIMERCNLPLNPTNNLVSLSRFFRQSRPLGASRKVYMDMVRALRRPNLSHSSLHQADRGREERGVSHYSHHGEDVTVRHSWSGEGRSRSQLPPTTEEGPPRATAVEHHTTPQPHSMSHDRSHDMSHDRSHDVAHNTAPEKAITQKDSLPLLPMSHGVTSARHSDPESPEDVTLAGNSGEIPDDVIADSDFTLEVDEGGYDSDSESESDEGDDLVGGTNEPQLPDAALPRNISEKAMLCTVEEKMAPLPKSFSVPNARSRTATTRLPQSSTPPLAPPLPPPLAPTLPPSLAPTPAPVLAPLLPPSLTPPTINNKQVWLAGGPQPRPQTTAPDSAGVRLGSALIRGPDVRRHKDKVAAAVEALEGMQQSSERLASCKPRRQDPYSSLPEGSQQREMGLPTAVLFTGSNLVGANPTHTTEQPTTHSTVTTSARDPESTQPASNPTHGSSSLKWQKPPPLSQVVDRGERLPQLVSHRSDPQSLPKGRQNGEKQGGERGEVGRARVWPSVSCDNQSSRPVVRGCFGRPSTSMSSTLQDGGIVPKSVTLDLIPPRVLHTSHSRTRPIL